MISTTRLALAGAALSLAACSHSEPASHTPVDATAAASISCPVSGDPEPERIDLTQLSHRLGSSQAVLLDVNSPETRKSFGVIPDAVRLSSSHYQLSELPPDRETELVFYCSNRTCGAAPRAARLAMQAGYCNVLVYEDGIMGWVTAGLAVEQDG